MEEVSCAVSRCPSAEIVPGDIVVIEEGATIPADARVIHSTALQVAEAALTGESVPVSKDVAAISGDAALGDRHNMIFSGTAATYGRARADGSNRDPRLLYGLGHAAFDFIESRWGKPGVRQFIFSLRHASNIGGDPYENALQVTREEFDQAFERYLRGRLAGSQI